MLAVRWVKFTTLSHLEDYAKKLVKAKELSKEGFVYLHVFTPCNVGWKTPTNATIDVCRTAVRTNYFPLWEADHGQFRITHQVRKPLPVSTLTNMLGKFKHLADDQVASLQAMVNKRYQVVQSLCGVGPN